MKIEIYGTGCPKCTKLYENACAAVKSAETAAEVIKVQDIQQIMNAGVMITPAIAVNGEVKASGKVLTPEEIRNMISPP